MTYEEGARRRFTCSFPDHKPRFRYYFVFKMEDELITDSAFGSSPKAAALELIKRVGSVQILHTYDDKLREVPPAEIFG